MTSDEKLRFQLQQDMQAVEAQLIASPVAASDEPAIILDELMLEGPGRGNG